MTVPFPTEIAKYAVTGAPDWFLSGVLFCSTWSNDINGGHAYIAYSSKPFIHIFVLHRILSDGVYSYYCSYNGRVEAHHEKISSLCFCEYEIPHLVSCGLDGLARYWKYSENDWLLSAELNIHSVREKIDPTTVSSTVNTTLSCSVTLIGTNKGLLIVWCVDNVNNKSNYICKKFENEASITSCWENCKFTSNSVRVAVGYKRGIVGVYAFQNSDITSNSGLSQLHRFYAHEKDVCHIMWSSWSDCLEQNECYSFDNIISTGRDQTVKVWKVSSHECVVSVRVPGHRPNQNLGDGKHGTQKDTAAGSPWISCCQLMLDGANSVLFSGLKGEMFLWNGSDSLNNIKPDGVGHCSLIFSMLYISNSHGIICTVGQDRSIIIWQINANKKLDVLMELPIISSGVCSLAQSNHGGSPFAAGLSDGSILLLKMGFYSQFNTNYSSGVTTKSLSPRGQQSSSITTLAWHPLPQFENILAYGTDAGCVEILDIMKFKKSQKSKSNLHPFGSTVYRVAWGPLLFKDQSNKQNNENTEMLENGTDDSNNTELESNSNNKHKKCKFPFYVYSICKGKLYCHIRGSMPPIDVGSKFPAPSGIAESEWKSAIRSDVLFLPLFSCDKTASLADIYDHYSCLIAIGYRSGHVDIYGLLNQNELNTNADQNDLQFICRLANHTKGVNCMAWCKENLVLAVGSNETFITISDLKSQLINAINKSHSMPFIQITSYLAKLEGHYNRITCLDWSSHDSSLLLSSSFDGTANVWQIPCDSKDEFKSIANFRFHRLRLFACLWSRLEPDIAFTGGEMSDLLGWQPSKQFYKEPPHSRRYRPPPFKTLTSDELLRIELNNSSTASLIDSCTTKSVIQNKPATELVEANSSNSSSLLINNESSSIKSSEPVKQKRNQTHSGEKRKRPALLPNLFQSSDNKQSEIDFESSPPIRFGSVLTQIWDVKRFVLYGEELIGCSKQWMLLLSECKQLRSYLIQYLNEECEYHLLAYQSGNKPNSFVHLDAYFMILIWTGQVSIIPSVMCRENHMPFWLVWAVHLAQSNLKAFRFYDSLDQSSLVHIDLLGNKIKEMRTNNPDALVASTLLVCANRVQEAVELLVSYDRIKEAIVLARLRLSPKDSLDLVQKYGNRLVERVASGEKSIYNTILSIGRKDWKQASEITYQEAEQMGLHCSMKTIEQLAWSWTRICLLSNDQDREHILIPILQSVTGSISFSFKLTDSASDCWSFLNKWYDTYSQLRSPDSKFPVFIVNVCLLLLDMSRYVCLLLEDPTCVTSTTISAANFESDLVVRKSEYLSCISPFTSDCANLLDCLVSDRQPSSQWAICLTNLLIDFALIYIVHSYNNNNNNKTPEQLLCADRMNSYVKRFQSSRQMCATLKPNLDELFLNKLLDVYHWNSTNNLPSL